MLSTDSTLSEKSKKFSSPSPLLEQIRATLRATHYSPRMENEYKLMAQSLYGCGLRLNECLSQRVKEVDFGERELLIRDAKSMKDRRASLLHPRIPDLPRITSTLNTAGGKPP